MLVAQCRERVQQIVHVEADGQIIDLGIGLDLFLRFFLLRVCLLYTSDAADE